MSPLIRCGCGRVTTNGLTCVWCQKHKPSSSGDGEELEDMDFVNLDDWVKKLDLDEEEEN